MNPKPSKRAKAKVALWKQKFLDLSSRNPQLNFKPKSAVELIHPDPSSLFRVGVVLGQTMVLPQVYKSKKKAKKSTSDCEIQDTMNESHKTSLEKKIDGK